MDEFGSRMKGYEFSYRHYLPKRLPVIIRIDGKAFHSYTKDLIKPFDENLASVMAETSKYLLENITGCKLAYYQSDEISLLLTNDDKLTTEPWFGNNIQKLVSISASLTTAYMNSLEWEGKPNKLAFFDSRVFVLPSSEVNNYFLWRQQDATKNSISMLAQSHYSQSELNHLNGEEMKKKLLTEKNVDWNDLDTWKKMGLCVKRPNLTKIIGERNSPEIDKEIPNFSKDTNYINQYLK